ncbi:MFS transporter [Tistrella mobilis]|uniref:Major facilitator transporter n=1 Tax=Tistrella mobilis (strain KA081020-065) TaxID=1110502 RepID=I3TS62_TISMK|nr:MFS transporter [Tistrella mobilis]AFK55600.1 major facilitator transporter [Tistrella mobilis KA081020-065]
MTGQATTTTSATAEPHTAPGLLLIGALYIAQGLPIGFAFEALPVLLRRAGVPLEMIAWVSLAGLPWVLKPLWAPLVDNRGGRRLGRRRAWIIPMQLILAAAMAGLAMIADWQAAALPVVVLTLIASIASATQDTATDGLAAERLHGGRLTRANALQSGGMMAGFMLGGSGLLWASGHLGVQAALAGLAGLLLAALLPVLGWAEPPADPDRHDRPRARLRAYFRRPGAWPVLIAGIGFALPYSGGLALSKLYLTDAGMALDRIGLIGIAGSLAMILIGCPLAVRMIGRHGTGPTLVSALVLTLAALGLWLLPVAGLVAPDLAVVLPASILLGTAGGAATTAAATLMMRFAARGNQAGTDVTIPQAAQVAGETLSGGVATGIAAGTGYAGALAAVLAAGLAGLVVTRAMLARPALRRLDD